jgi:NAD(P)-dependent dehydrogenase (short-subunit alcohol dehydrogenase family)
MVLMSEDRVAVVTGGGRGIGRGIVLELATLRISVVVNYRADAAAADEVCLEAQHRGAPRAIPVQADIADLGQGRSLLDQTLAEFGRVDIWVNNAGVAPTERVDLLETTPESWDRVVGIDLRGPFFLTQAVSHAMIELSRAGAVPQPQIFFITSISSVAASIMRGEYCVAKAGLSMVAQLFAVRLAEHGVQVTEVRPGIIATDMTAAVREDYDRRIAQGLSPIRRWGTPEDVGRTVAALAASGRTFSTGDIVYVDGGLHLNRL